MSKWVRGIYNTAANFVMSGSLRAASGRTMDRDAKQLSKESLKPNKCGKSCQSDKSCQSNDGHACTCHPARTCNCSAGDCADNDTACASDGKLPNNHGDSCTCSLCRDYRDYINATGSAAIRTEGQGAGSRIRFSHEPRDNKQSTSISTDPVEHITGIQSGVTV